MRSHHDSRRGPVDRILARTRAGQAQAEATSRMRSSTRDSSHAQGRLSGGPRGFSARTPGPASTRSRTEIGLAEQALHRWVEAETDLAGTLSEEAGDAWLESHRSLLEKALADVHTHLGMLTVETGPRGAQVKINGELRGLLPLSRPLFLLPGTVQVEITAPERRRGAARFRSSSARRPAGTYLRAARTATCHAGRVHRKHRRR